MNKVLIRVSGLSAKEKLDKIYLVKYLKDRSSLWGKRFESEVEIDSLHSEKSIRVQVINFPEKEDGLQKDFLKTICKAVGKKIPDLKIHGELFFADPRSEKIEM